jgi:hypothetical protein
MEPLIMPGNITPLRHPSCTTDPYLLNTARLHRVDASQLPKGTGVSLGHCRTFRYLCFQKKSCADSL